MTIVLNGKKEVLEQQKSIRDLLISKNIDPNTVVVEYNGDIVKREEWANIFLNEDDVLEVVRFVGGG
ncbi:MAG: sulfur carrier protein ThiS [Clostridiaceae bacterium]|nr:sulfur carrier protein ThiS [Clostridiaceae bacterium]